VAGTPSRNRGRTSPGRLALLDRFLLENESALLKSHPAATVLDVGVGEHPWTALELAESVRRVHPERTVIGLEADEGRLKNANAHSSDARTSFQRGDFATPLPSEPPAVLVRALNVLRGHSEEEVPKLWVHLAQPLVEGGLLIEGTSDPGGHILSAFLIRKTREGLNPEALVFLTDFERGFAPWMFRDVLPRLFRRRVKPGEAVHGFLSAWHAAWQHLRESRTDLDEAKLFASSCAELSEVKYGPGALLWRLE
jgi:hypothetical protein